MDFRRSPITDRQWLIWLLPLRALQWVSSVIVMGITSAFISVGPRVLVNVYTEVISVISVVIFAVAFVIPFVSRQTLLKRVVLQIDIWMSYLWLTSFIFEGRAYDNGRCAFLGANKPCSQKRANQAFTFFVFITTFFAILIEVVTPWITERHEHHPIHEKNGHLHDGNYATNGANGVPQNVPQNGTSATPTTAHGATGPDWTTGPSTGTGPTGQTV